VYVPEGTYHRKAFLLQEKVAPLKFDQSQERHILNNPIGIRLKTV
jgi:hypothetical protein